MEPAPRRGRPDPAVGTLKLLLAVLGVAAIGFAPAAPADPGSPDAPGVDEAAVSDNAAFLVSLRSAGITYTDPDQVISAARAVCGLVDRGEPALEVISDLKTTNPGFTTDGAAQFAAISARSYCPHQLVKK